MTTKEMLMEAYDEAEKIAELRLLEYRIAERNLFEANRDATMARNALRACFKEECKQQTVSV